MNYELWSLSSRNIVADFKTEAAALRAVAAIVRQQGHAAALDLLLGSEDPAGRSRRIAHGQDLVDRALAASPSSPVSRLAV